MSRSRSVRSSHTQADVPADREMVRGEMERELWIVGGANGAGKTTWIREILPSHPDAVYLSADQIAAEISPKRPEKAKIEAGREFIRRMRASLSTGQSMIIESTLSGRNMRRFLELARQQDYQIVIVFIFLETPDLCVQRVAERVRKGGHDVPEADIRRRHVRSMERFWSIYRSLADSWHLYFNAGQTFQKVAMANADGQDILIPELFELFKEGAGEP